MKAERPPIIHLMAKNKFPKGYMRGVVNAELTTSVLAAKTASKTSFPEAVSETARISSVVARYSMQNFTPTEDSGPVMVGLAHSDYTVAEIEQWIENVNGWDSGDMVQRREIQRRLIRQVGIFDTPADLLTAVTLNDGKAIKTKLNWPLATSQTVALWAYNLGIIGFVTAVDIDCRGHANLWQKY